MSDIHAHMQIAQAIVSGGVGLVGVGIGLGIFRNTIRQINKSVRDIKLRQAKLRGEDNGGVPRYVSTGTCDKARTSCKSGAEKDNNNMLIELNSHSESIKGLNNFARWWMQKEGLNIQEISNILKG